MPQPKPDADRLAPSLRVFFALWPDANARERLAAAALDVAAQTKGVAPPAANLHVTLMDNMGLRVGRHGDSTGTVNLS